MASSIGDIADEVAVRILSYLRATDLASTREVDKTVFSAARISAAVKQQLDEIYTLPLPAAPKKSNATGAATSDNQPTYRPDILYVREVNSILFAITAPQPPPGKGYWISSSWLNNTKKYMEALTLPEPTLSTGSARKTTPAKQKKLSRIRQRRGSDALPPWPIINSDIICPHGELSLAKGSVVGRRRRAISSRYWHFLRRFYPDGPAFKICRASDCVKCSCTDVEAKAHAAGKREAAISGRRNDLVPPTLTALSLRRCGVPMHCVSARVTFFNELNEQADLQASIEATEASAGISTGGGAAGAAAVWRDDNNSPKSSASDSDCGSSGSDRGASPIHQLLPPRIPENRNSAMTATLAAGKAGYTASASYTAAGANDGAGSSAGCFSSPSTVAMHRVSAYSTPGSTATSSSSALDSLATHETEADTPLPPCQLFSHETAPVAAVASSAGAQVGQLSASINDMTDLQQPLIPGLYNLVPKYWLKQWRRYLKDASVATLPPLDCSRLICQSHGLLVLPPHLEEYLLGLRRSLLGGLGTYMGEVVEIVSADEWDDLQNVLHDGGVSSDCSIRMCLDGAEVSWNIGMCSICDPFSYNPQCLHSHSVLKPSPNAQPFNGTANGNLLA